MMTLLMASIYMIVSTSLSVKTPIKMCTILAATSLMIFVGLYLESSASWMPLILYLLFMGGILIMFMIISATMPNTKEKNSMNGIFNFFMILILMESYFNKGGNQVAHSPSIMLNMISILFMVVLLMTLYFSAFLTFILKTTMSLRKLSQC